jgi:hypothetical protein
MAFVADEGGGFVAVSALVGQTWWAVWKDDEPSGRCSAKLAV